MFFSWSHWCMLLNYAIESGNLWPCPIDPWGWYPDFPWCEASIVVLKCASADVWTIGEPRNIWNMILIEYFRVSIRIHSSYLAISADFPYVRFLDELVGLHTNALSDQNSVTPQCTLTMRIKLCPQRNKSDRFLRAATCPVPTRLGI